MKVLELFAGSRSIGKAAEKLGHEVFSVDWKPFDKIDLSIDIEFLTIDQIPFIPDMTWISPDCATYAIMAVDHHRDGHIPTSEYAKKCDRVNKNCHDLIRQWLVINPNMKFFIENPRGMMRKMPFMMKFTRTTITYCQYGDTRMKPTDIWSNNIRSLFNPDGWKPRPMCKKGSTCHESAPRGSQTGTLNRKGSYERSVIPEQLCIEVIQSVEIFQRLKQISLS